MTLPLVRRARVAALLVTLAAAASAQESTKEPPRIEDNSFLAEESAKYQKIVDFANIKE